MPPDPRAPVLVGVAQLAQRPDDPRDGAEPLVMMVDAARRAAEDAGSAALLERADSVRVSRGAWHYDNAPGALAERIGAAGAETVQSPFGGNMVQTAVNQTARQIAAGEHDVVLLAGAEHGLSQARARKAGIELEYTPTRGVPDRLLVPDKPMVHEAEIARRVFRPVQIYPMFENAIRHRRGESLERHIERVSELWEGFNRVARGNPDAWLREAYDAKAIRTPSPDNRMVGWPYPKLMNSNNAVDQAAALILCSVEAARRAGVPEERWIFPHAGTDASDPLMVSHRLDFHSSPAIRLAGRRVLELADVEAGGLDHVDLYSCFPSAVQVAAEELGLGFDRPLTVTGGLTFGGGPLNNYVMHAIARMAELLRASPGQRGLVTGNGGYLSKHAFGVYSSEPPAAGFRHEDLQAEVDAFGRREAVVDHDGPVTIESYTVLYGEDGPDQASAACLLEDGRRTWAVSSDPELMAAMVGEEFCGRPARIDGRGTLLVH